MIIWLFVGIILLISSYFSCSEMVFNCCNPIRLKFLAHKKGVLGYCTKHFMANSSRFFTTTLIGNNFVNVIYGIVATIILQIYLGFTLSLQWGHPLMGYVVLLILQTLIASLFLLFLGELIPKMIGRIY